MKMLRSIIFSLVALLVLTGATWAAETPFYKGKTIRIIVGYSPGGGFDTFSRLLGRYLSQNVPGNPSVRVMNMPGAGSKSAANISKSAPPAD